MRALRKNVIVKAVSVISACGLIICCGTFSADRLHADSVSDLQATIQQLQERNKDLEAQISALGDDIRESEKLQQLYFEKLTVAREQLDAVNNLLYYKEQEIDEKQREIDELDRQIASKEREISLQEAAIAEFQAENEANLSQFGEILRAMYVTENSDFFSVLAESSDIYDMLVRTKLMLNISKQNSELMSSLKESIEKTREMKNQLLIQKNELNAQKETAERERRELEAAKADLEQQRQLAQELTDQYNEYYEYYAAQIDNIEQMQDQLEAQIEVNKEEIEAYEQKIQEEIRAAQQNSSQSYQEGDWIWPVGTQFSYITTYFGYDADWDRIHRGIDIGDAGINNTAVYASKSGTVITAKNTYIQGYSYGKYVVIDHGDGYSTLYGHCSEIYVTVGQTVSQGDVIAAVGSTGQSTAPHMHFEVRLDSVAQNPFDYVHW